MTRGKVSLNLATIRRASFPRQLQAAYGAGFPAVGLWYDELRKLSANEMEEFHLSSLVVSELVGVSGWMDIDLMSRTIALARAEQVFEAAANLRCEVVVAEPDRSATDLVRAARHFRELCRLAQPFPVNVGLEFHGGARAIKDIAAAWQVVEAAEAQNGGVVLDAFHCYRGGSRVEMLEPVPGDRILLVQVSDCMDLPRYELDDRHRLYPGQGAIPLEPLLAALRDKGYSGYYSLELMNEDYWLEDPATVARDAMRALRRLEIT